MNFNCRFLLCCYVQISGFLEVLKGRDYGCISEKGRGIEGRKREILF